MTRDVIREMCVIIYLKEYISRRDRHMNLPSEQLIIILQKPFKCASTDTMRRWIKGEFVKNNIIEFSPHSCWAASTSKAKSIEVNIDDIITRGCWKRRENFFKFYDKNMVKFASDDMKFNCICQIYTLFTELYNAK